MGGEREKRNRRGEETDLESDTVQVGAFRVRESFVLDVTSYLRDML